jgi:hypothetical protein
MIPNYETRLVTSGGVAASAPFGISSTDTAHIMEILRDMYSDRILALLREYSANAWDAHNEFGKGLIPILVTLPLDEDPNLRIRDYGPGLSIEEVFTVYNQYGRSSKRGTNLAVGQLGIGSKSAFCYSDSFTITSFHGGKKRIFIAVIDSSNMGKIDLVHEEDSEETGVEIQIAVKPGDIHEFHAKARNLFRHYKVRPTINIDLPPAPLKKLELVNGNLRSNDGLGWLAIMGCVPYRVNTAQIDTSQVGEHLARISGELYFDIGEVDMAPNREELKYTDRTRTTLIDKFNALVDEFIQQTMGTIESGEFTPWEKRLRAQILNQLDLPIPKQWKEITDHSVKIEYLGIDFTLIHNKSPSTRISVEAGTRILIDDTGKELVGYHLTFSDWVMRPTEGQTLEWSRGRLDEALEKAGLKGVTIQLLSTIPWTAPYRKPPKQTNPKHKVSQFKLVPNAAHKSPWSNCWTAVKRIPEKTDVFVIVRNFKALEYRNFFAEYAEDRNMMGHFGGIMPEVYGYKSTEKKPVDPGKLEGTLYEVWRKGLALRLATPELLDMIDATHWAHLSNDNYVAMPGNNDLMKLSVTLGDSHPIIETLQRQSQIAKTLNAVSSSKKEALSSLAHQIDRRFSQSAAKRAVDAIYQTYPLLELTKITSLWDYRNHSKWTDYVKMVDRLNAVLPYPPPPKHNVVTKKNGHNAHTLVIDDVDDEDISSSF